MSRVLCLLHDGFEEIEAVVPIDLLRRAGVEVVIASVSGSRELAGRSGIRLLAEEVLEDSSPDDFAMLLLPGGPAVQALRRDGRAAGLARAFADAGKDVAAICAAPLILLDAGLLDGVPHTSHASTHAELTNARPEERVVEHGGIITARGAGTAMDFALVLVRRLAGAEAAEHVARSIMA